MGIHRFFATLLPSLACSYVMSGPLVWAAVAGDVPRPGALAVSADDVAAVAGKQLPSLEGYVHQPYLAWRVEVTDIGDLNPYDVVASATFSHEGDSLAYTVPLFYAGADTFEFRFTAPRTGVWEVRTSSRDAAGLDGLTTRAVVVSNPNPAAKGYLVAVTAPDGSGRFGYLTGDDGVPRVTRYDILCRLVADHPPEPISSVRRISADPIERAAQIEGKLDLVEELGLQAARLGVAHAWVEYDGSTSRSRNTEPDDTTFTILEDYLARAHARGLFVHLWAWSDTQAGSSSERLVDGTNGTVDRRIQRMIAGRLGAFPNWSMSYAYDLHEWVTPEEVRDWHANMRSLSSLPRLYAARESVGRTGLTFALGQDKLEVFSNDLRPAEGFYRVAREAFYEASAGTPVMFERRFWKNRDGVWTEEVTRRAMWQFAMAGGASAIWGQFPDPSAYEDPAVLKTVSDFLQPRLAMPLVVTTEIDGTPVDGWVLASPDAAHQIVYREDARRVEIVIPEGVGSAKVIAQDARRVHGEVFVGAYGSGVHVIDLGTNSDWAISVGDFGLDPR